MFLPCCKLFSYKMKEFRETREFLYFPLPLAGAPSMTSYLIMVSLSLYMFDPVPAVSLLMMAISMCLILIRTSKK